MNRIHARHTRNRFAPRMSGIGFTLMDVAGGADNAVMTSNPPPSELAADDVTPMPTDKLGTNALDHSLTRTTSMTGEEQGGAPIALYVLGAAAIAGIVYLILK